MHKLTLTPDAIEPEDVAALRAAGIDDPAIVDLVYVCMVFNVIDRIADALDFDVPPQADFARSARHLLRRGYRM